MSVPWGWVAIGYAEARSASAAPNRCAAWSGRGGVLAAPGRGFAGIPGVCGLRMLLAPVEAVQAVHRHESGHG